MNFYSILGFEIMPDEKNCLIANPLKKMVSQTFMNFKI